MSAHARRYSRIREWRTARPYTPKHRKTDAMVLADGFARALARMTRTVVR